MTPPPPLANRYMGRGHKYDVQHASKMMRNMLKWRKANGINDIREDIVKNKKFHPW